MEKVLVIGSLNCDYVINVQKMPQIGETLLCDGFEMIPGGKGANQAYAIGKLGGEVTMLGAVGNDGPGSMLRANLKGVGVDVSRLKCAEGESTGTAFITVDSSGGNSIIVVQGANGTVDVPYIKANDDVLEASDIVLLQMEIPMETVVYSAKRAKELGKTVILDPAPARSDIPRELYGCVDYIKPNEVELGMLIGDSVAESHLEESAALLQERGVKNVVVTLGSKGAFLLDGKGSARSFPANSSLRAVDTTAAGDSFTAALAYGLSEGRELHEALELAICVSEIVVTRKGAQTSIPDMDEVQRFLAQKI